MIRLTGCVSGLTGLLLVACPVQAQVTDSFPGSARGAAPVLSAEWARAQEMLAIQQDQAGPGSGFAVDAGPIAQVDAAFGPALTFRDDGGLGDLPSSQARRIAARQTVDPRDGYAVVERRDIWRTRDTYSDRLRVTTRGDLRRLDGAPVPPTVRDSTGLEVQSYDVTYTRGWEAARGQTASGLEVSLTPHAGVGVGDRGGTAEAGATLRIGSNLDNVAPRGSERFGDRARWYVYAAGSGRAVGYNFARTRDGDYARSGMSHDAGAFLGDASVGVAYRRGDLQGSFGLVYREIKAEGLRGGEGFDREVTEGVVGFQLSIKPDR